MTIKKKGVKTLFKAHPGTQDHFLSVTFQGHPGLDKLTGNREGKAELLPLILRTAPHTEAFKCLGCSLGRKYDDSISICLYVGGRVEQGLGELASWL